MMKKLALTLAALTFALSASAEGYKSYKDVPIATYNWQASKFDEFSLSNGISGVVVEDHEVQIVDFYFLFPAPPDSKAKAGLADMTTWVMRNGGTKTITGDSLNSIIEYKAGSIGIGGGDDYAYIWGNCLTEDLPLFLGLVDDIIENPSFPQEKIDLHRGSVIEGIKRRNDETRGIARRELYKLLYAGHPWGEETTEQSIKSLIRDDLIAYQQLVFRAKGLVIGFSGDINADQAKKLTKKAFSGLKKSGADIAKLPDRTGEPEPGVYYGFKDINQAYLNAGHLSISYSDPRRIAADVMNYVLGGGGFASILMRKVRQEAGLTYGIGTTMSMPVGVKGSFRVGTSTRLDQAGRSLALTLDQIKAFAKDGPTEQEFNDAKQAFLNSYVWRFESASDVLGTAVGNKWRGLPLDTPQRDYKAYQALTWEDVKKAAQQLVKPENLVIVVIGNKEKMDRKLEDFGTVRTLDLNAQ